MLEELARFPFRITIETQLFKYLPRIPFVKEDYYLRKSFNEELANKKSGWVTKMRNLLGSYGVSNLILNIFKAFNDEIDKKEYKNKRRFLQKRAKNCSEAATQRCSWEKVFWKYAANLQENTHAEVRFQ